jgi:hypothetical protein
VSFSTILCRASGVLRGFIVPNWIIATCSRELELSRFSSWCMLLMFGFRGIIVNYLFCK